MKRGVQYVTTNITQTNAPLTDVTNGTLVVNDTPNSRSTPFDIARSFMQVASISYATQALLLGTMATAYENRTVGKPSFLDINVDKQGVLLYSWGDVLKGIEEISHNVTAALLTLSLEL